MHKTFWFLLLFVAAFMPPAHADEAQPCDSTTIKAVADWVGVQKGAYDAACKVMPNAPRTTIAAMAFYSGEVVAGDGVVYGRRFLQVIALVEAGKVVAASHSTLEEDSGFGFRSYRIDTARYILSGDVRAFGVVLHYDPGTHKCINASAGEYELTLWIREGENLRPIFGTNLHGWVQVKGELCPYSGWYVNDGEDADTPHVSESAEMTISIEKTSSHGFADLAITARVTRESITLTLMKRTVRTVLKYDGKSYGINMFRTFWWPLEVCGAVPCPEP